MRYLRTNAGQFIPFAAMMMLTMAMFMVAILNVYKVSRAKLKVQNLADAAALNLAAQQAQAMNAVASTNEWMNRMVAGAPSPSDTNGDCSAFGPNRPTLIPGIACVETAGGQGHLFPTRWGAINYAMLVRTVNVSQKMFVAAYNSFLGVPGSVQSSSALSGPSNFVGLLKKDIPEFNKDYRLYAWNSGTQDPGGTQPERLFQGNSIRLNSQNMSALVPSVDHNIQTRYMSQGRGGGIEKTSFRQLLYGKTNYGDKKLQGGPLYGDPNAGDVGWMRLQAPMMAVTRNGSRISRPGVGVYVHQDLNLPLLGHKDIVAKSSAYIVQKSGDNGGQGGNPVFKPTYWVKLSN